MNPRAARYMERGRRSTRKGSYQEALDYYQLALDCTSDPLETAVIYYYMAHALANSDRYEESRDYAGRSLEAGERVAGRTGFVAELRSDVRQVLDYIQAREHEVAGPKK